MINDMISTGASYHRRLSILTIFLASMAFLLVVTSVGAFLYVTRKEKILRRLHLISVIIMIIIELGFLVAIIFCCTTQTKNSLGQILAVFLILISLFVLMILIYFLLEDVIKEKIGPYPHHFNPYKSYEICEIKSVSRHESPRLVLADEKAIPIIEPTIISSYPRLPTPPTPSILSPLPTPDNMLSLPSNQNTFTVPQESSSVVDLDKARRDLLAAIEERTIPALEEAIQQVKDHNFLHQLKYECERALELLHRLMKIEHMKIRVLRLNQATIAELHSYTKPPDEVSTVMRATFLLLGHCDKEIQDWAQIQNLLGRLGKDSVRRRCYELSPLHIPVEKAHEAKDILRNYDLIRVSEISIGLAAFFSWAVTMIDEREKLLESQRQIGC
ncbi:unnamed protein product [Adineta ricciae]|uniref:Uncharacterized protein n=1 Tax=Adineta ricciae TaxID=249248 RepID=A0A814L6J1_ADIRI|nr:unnamed protein product [Adineta ricciae]CAF1061660.1 unnamed protein product [Adineta ricciae]